MNKLKILSLLVGVAALFGIVNNPLAATTYTTNTVSYSTGEFVYGADTTGPFGGADGVHTTTLPQFNLPNATLIAAQLDSIQYWNQRLTVVDLQHNNSYWTSTLWSDRVLTVGDMTNRWYDRWDFQYTVDFSTSRILSYTPWTGYASNLTPLVGPGTVTVTLTQLSTLDYTNPGNLDPVIYLTSTTYVKATITYTYVTPAIVPPGGDDDDDDDDGGNDHGHGHGRGHDKNKGNSRGKKH